MQSTLSPQQLFSFEVVGEIHYSIYDKLVDACIFVAQATNPGVGQKTGNKIYEKTSRVTKKNKNKFVFRAKAKKRQTRTTSLLSDTKLGENIGKQIVRGYLSGDFA